MIITIEIYFETKHATAPPTPRHQGWSRDSCRGGGGKGRAPAVGCIIGDETKQIVVARHLFCLPHHCTVIPYNVKMCRGGGRGRMAPYCQQNIFHVSIIIIICSPGKHIWEMFKILMANLCNISGWPRGEKRGCCICGEI